MSHSIFQKLRSAALVATCSALFVACGSDDDSGPNAETDGAEAANTNGGTTNGGSTQASTTGSVEQARPCGSDSTRAPSNGIIATFDGGDEPLEPRTLAFPVGGNVVPHFEFEDGGLHVTAEVPATAEKQYPGIALGFNGCVDASAFDGVEFSISGSFSGCSLTFASGDAAHQDATTGAPIATGAPGAFQPQTLIAGRMDSSEAVPLRVPFTQQTGGNPDSPIDASELIFMLWQLNVPTGGDDAEPCLADLRIDDVKFYKAED